MNGRLAVNQAQNLDLSSGVTRHLFLLSFDERDALAAQISGFGWRVVSARREQRLKARFLASRALVCVIDLRHSIDEGLSAIADISDLVESGGIAVIAIGDPTLTADVAKQSYAAGATHFFDISSSLGDFETCLKFAYRHVVQVHGGTQAVEQFSALLTQQEEQWSMSIDNFSDCWVSESFRDRYDGLDFDHYPATAVYRQMTAEERAKVRGAMGRLRMGAGQAAVVHHLGSDHVIHHLHQTDSRLHGRIEHVDEHKYSADWTGQDLLSGLRNGPAARTWIRERLENGEQLSLVALGIRNFGTINAAYGRAIGDEVMRAVGQRLLHMVQSIDEPRPLVARMDGQNFVIGSSIETSSEEMIKSTQSMLDEMFENLVLNGRQIQLEARAGIAVSGDSADEAVLIRRAMLALAEAMNTDTINIRFSGASEQDILLEQALESELAHALQREEITIALQPQLRVDTGQLVGAEALARWDHPKYDFLGAATLFSVAERAGLLNQLSAHIHDRALAIAGGWPDSLSFLRLSVNVTAGDLADTGFAKRFQELVKRHGCKADRITLEITESGLIADLKQAAGRLELLRSQGLRIAIDDFGTGYSSLAYLKGLPLDYLKIDSGLTEDIGGSAKDQVVVRSIIDMAHSLELEVIAEGVETEAQLKLLQKHKCQYYQGFLRSGPLSSEEFEIFALRSD